MGHTEDRLSAAKLWLISQGNATAADAPRDLPYLAQALYSIKAVETTAVAGISADEHWRLYANPIWIGSVDIPEIGRELAHLIWHLLMDHAGRARSMRVDLGTADQWHQACEITIHETLAPIETSPAETRAVASHTRGRRGVNCSAEQYYAFLSGLPPTLPDGRRVYSLGCDRQDGNLGLLQTGELEWDWLQIPR